MKPEHPLYNTKIESLGYFVIDKDELPALVKDYQGFADSYGLMEWSHEKLYSWDLSVYLWRCSDVEYLVESELARIYQSRYWWEDSSDEKLFVIYSPGAEVPDYIVAVERRIEPVFFASLVEATGPG